MFNLWALMLFITIGHVTKLAVSLPPEKQRRAASSDVIIDIPPEEVTKLEESLRPKILQRDEGPHVIVDIPMDLVNVTNAVNPNYFQTVCGQFVDEIKSFSDKPEVQQCVDKVIQRIANLKKNVYTSIATDEEMELIKLYKKHIDRINRKDRERQQAIKKDLEKQSSSLSRRRWYKNKP